MNKTDKKGTGGKPDLQINVNACSAITIEDAPNTEAHLSGSSSVHASVEIQNESEKQLSIVKPTKDTTVVKSKFCPPVRPAVGESKGGFRAPTKSQPISQPAKEPTEMTPVLTNLISQKSGDKLMQRCAKLVDESLASDASEHICIVPVKHTCLAPHSLNTADGNKAGAKSINSDELDLDIVSGSVIDDDDDDASFVIPIYGSVNERLLMS